MTHDEILKALYDQTLVGNAPEVLRLTNQALQDGMTPAGQWTYAYAASTAPGETKQTTVTDARGNTTVSGYNSLNQMLRHVDEEGYARTFGFDGRGLINLIKNENGDTIIFNHDVRGNVTSQVDAAGYTTYFDYYLNTSDPNDLRNDRRRRRSFRDRGRRGRLLSVHPHDGTSEGQVDIC